MHGTGPPSDLHGGHCLQLPPPSLIQVGTSTTRKRQRTEREPSTNAILHSLMGKDSAAVSTVATVVSQLNELLAWVALEPRFLACPLSSGKQESALHELHHAIVCALALCRSVGVHEGILTPGTCTKDGVRAKTACALAAVTGTSELRPSLVRQVLSDELSSLTDLNTITIQAHRLGLSPDAAHSLLRSVCPPLVHLRGSSLRRGPTRRAAAALREAIACAHCTLCAQFGQSGHEGACTVSMSELRAEPSPAQTTSPTAQDPPKAVLTPSASDVAAACKEAEALQSVLLGQRHRVECGERIEPDSINPSAPAVSGSARSAKGRATPTEACPRLLNNDTAISALFETPINSKARLRVRVNGGGVSWRSVEVITCGGASLPGLDTTSTRDKLDDSSPTSDRGSTSDDDDDGTGREPCLASMALSLHTGMVKANKRARAIALVRETERTRDLLCQRKGTVLLATSNSMPQADVACSTQAQQSDNGPWSTGRAPSKRHPVLCTS